MLSLGIMSKFPQQCQNRPFCTGHRECRENTFSLILWLLHFNYILQHRKQNNRNRHSKALFWFEKEPLLHLCLAYFEYFICHGIAIYNLIQTYFSSENRGKFIVKCRDGFVYWRLFSLSESKQGCAWISKQCTRNSGTRDIGVSWKSLGVDLGPDFNLCNTVFPLIIMYN